MIQLNEVATNPISGEYLIAVVIALLLLGACFCGGIVKFRRDQY